MISKEEALRQSVVINSLRLPATLLVIASHCVITLKTTSLPYSLSADNIFLILEHLCLSFGPIAVSLFSMITGYFFFYKLQSYSFSIYKTEINKRVKTLLLPYLLWNIIAIILLYFKNYVGEKAGLDFAYSAKEVFVLGHYNLLELIVLPINGPLWYVRDIIGLVLLSPLIYILIYKRTLGKIAIIGLFGVSYFAALRLGHIPLFFLLGAYLGFHKESVLLFAEKFKIPSYLFGWVYIYLRIFHGGDAWATNLHLYALFCTIVALVNLGNTLYKRNKALSDYWASFTPAVFFMYAVHAVLVINLVRGTLYAILPWNDAWEKIVTLLVTATVVPIICYYMYKVLSKLFPRISLLLSGGRG